ncbi:hypothetical protein DSCW_51010 [Desulfosarcina widdelii]|uniref:Uncharacterized protein n=1 Tax=Desulfosarcina widdelii TaxID=947919 RepID=A0A5K7ZH79_9BACT|nr:hypothetical protein [Desulfosarcina widdelii]BBO77684.1 hypothetical protein DSCW_51010 [Desulfosarcina widdelii]
MDAEKAKQFVKLLCDNDLSTKTTHGQAKKYRGASPTNMNQYFKITGGDLAGVQSVQLEFAKKDVRVGKSIAETAVKVAKAISALLKCETVNIPEDKADEDLVKEATDKVMEAGKELLWVKWRSPPKSWQSMTAFKLLRKRTPVFMGQIGDESKIVFLNHPQARAPPSSTEPTQQILRMTASKPRTNGV